MPPLDFQIGQLRADPQRHGDTVGRLLARAGGACRQVIRVSGGQNGGLGLDRVEPPMTVIEHRRARDPAIVAGQKGGRRALLVHGDAAVQDLPPALVQDDHTRSALLVGD